MKTLQQLQHAFNVCTLLTHEKNLTQARYSGT